METQPDYIAYLAQLRKRQAEAAQEQALANIFGGISEFAEARSGGGGGASHSKVVERPSGDLTLGQFGEFQKRKEGIIATAEDNKRIDSIVADPRVGGRISKEALLTLRANNPPAYAKLVADFFDPQTDTKILEDGTFVSRAKNAPAGTPYLPTGTVDTAKGEKSAADLEKTKAETGKIGVETDKAREEITKTQLEQLEVQARTGKTITEDQVKKLELLDPKELKSPENLERLSALTGIPAETLATMDPKSIVSETGKILTSQQQGQGAARTQIAGKQVEEGQKTLDKASMDMAERAARRAVLERTKLNTGYLGAETFGQLAVTLFPGSEQAEAERLTRQYLAQSAGEVISAGQDMKGAFSEKDRQMLQDAVAGSRNLSSDEMMRVLAIRDLLDRKRIDRATTSRSRGRKAIGAPDDDVDDTRPPPLQKHELRAVDANVVTEAVRSPEGRRYLASIYGKSTADDLIARQQEVVNAKLPPEVVQSYRQEPLKDLIARKTAIEAMNRSKYGYDSAGVLDLIIAQRQAAGEK